MSVSLAAGLATIVVWMLVAYGRRASARSPREYARAEADAAAGWLALVLLIGAWLLPDSR